MQSISLIRFFKLALSLFLTAIYFFIVWIASVDLGEKSFISVVRHAVLITGFVPWCFWMFSLLSNKGLKFILYAVLVTVFHVFVFAVSAHYDGLMYWFIQLIELIFLVPIVNHSIHGRS